MTKLHIVRLLKQKPLFNITINCFKKFNHKITLVTKLTDTEEDDDTSQKTVMSCNCQDYYTIDCNIFPKMRTLSCNP